MPRHLLTIFLVSLLLPTLANTTESITRTKLEDTPAYSSVISARGCEGGCCRECATDAINSFRTAHNCDPIDPFTCLCMDKTLSVNLQTAIANSCFNACGALIVPIATRLLDGYCAINGGEPEAQFGSPATVSATPTDENSSSATFTSTTLSRSGSQIPSLGPTSTPPADDSRKKDGLSSGDKIGIGIGSVAGLAGVIGVIFTFLTWWRPRHPRGNNNVAEGGDNIPLNERAGDVPAAVPR